MARTIAGALPGWAGYLALRALAAKIARSPLTAEQSFALSQARNLHYGKRGINQAWEWGEGPLVVLVHGWGGSAAQLAPLAAHIAAQGYRSVAIEVTGHGRNPGDRTSWAHFIEDIICVCSEAAEDVHAIIGHSAGGLAMMAACRLDSLNVRKCVCICAPSYPYPPINVVRQRLNPTDSAIMYYKKFIADQFRSTWEHLQNGAAYRGIHSELLLVYDESDRFVDPADGAIIQSWRPDAQLLMTQSYGHNRILMAPELFDRVTLFIK